MARGGLKNKSACDEMQAFYCKRTGSHCRRLHKNNHLLMIRVNGSRGRAKRRPVALLRAARLQTTWLGERWTRKRVFRITVYERRRGCTRQRLLNGRLSPRRMEVQELWVEHYTPGWGYWWWLIGKEMLTTPRLHAGRRAPLRSLAGITGTDCTCRVARYGPLCGKTVLSRLDGGMTGLPASITNVVSWSKVLFCLLS